MKKGNIIFSFTLDTFSFYPVLIFFKKNPIHWYLVSTLKMSYLQKFVFYQALFLAAFHYAIKSHTHAVMYTQSYICTYTNTRTHTLTNTHEYTDMHTNEHV